MKPHVIRYDEMHVYILTDDTGHSGNVTLSPYRTPPKFSDFMFKRITLFRRYYTPEVLEFLKTKAQSVNYYDKW